jgi:hypothetical protein
MFQITTGVAALKPGICRVSGRLQEKRPEIAVVPAKNGLAGLSP